MSICEIKNQYENVPKEEVTGGGGWEAQCVFWPRDDIKGFPGSLPSWYVHRGPSTAPVSSVGGRPCTGVAAIKPGVGKAWACSGPKEMVLLLLPTLVPPGVGFFG